MNPRADRPFSFHWSFKHSLFNHTSIFVQEEYRYDNDSNQQNIADSPSATGPGWAQRVKGWFSSVRQCVLVFMIWISTHHRPLAYPAPQCQFIFSFVFFIIVCRVLSCFYLLSSVILSHTFCYAFNCGRDCFSFVTKNWEIGDWWNSKNFVSFCSLFHLFLVSLLEENTLLVDGMAYVEILFRFRKRWVGSRFFRRISDVLYLQGTNDDPKNKEKKKKPATKMIELTLEAKTHGYSIDELRKFHEEEVSSHFTRCW